MSEYLIDTMSDDLTVAPATYAPTGHPEWTAPLAPLASEPMLHSTVAQQILKDICPTTIKAFNDAVKLDHDYEYSPLEKNVLFLGHLCACGLFDEAEQFILLTEDKVELLNTRCYNLYSGTVLNMALYWNSGDLGYKFFTMLTSYGAGWHPDVYGLFPHQQTGTLWTTITTMEVIGKRNPDEFTMLYTKLHLVHEE